MKGGLLKWIHGYLSNKTAIVLFNGTCGTPKCFEMGTPQGGVLSPLLFIVFMHRLLSLSSLISLDLQLPAIKMTFASTLIHHRISSSSPTLFLIHQQPVVSSSPRKKKNRIFSSRNPRTVPDFTTGRENCSSMLAVSLLGHESFRQSQHDRGSASLSRTFWTNYRKRFTLIKWLANNAAGVSIPLAKTIFVMYM